MLSLQALAEAPTAPGHDLNGRGNPIRNIGSVKRGSNGADRMVAMTITTKMIGSRRMDVTMRGMLEDRRCFSMEYDVTSMTTKQYNLSISCKLRSRIAPTSRYWMPRPAVNHQEEGSMVRAELIMWTIESSMRA